MLCVYSLSIASLLFVLCLVGRGQLDGGQTHQLWRISTYWSTVGMLLLSFRTLAQKSIILLLSFYSTYRYGMYCTVLYIQFVQYVWSILSLVLSLNVERTYPPRPLNTPCELE